MFDYAALEALAAVLREGSFERAARRLHVTPSAISQRIKQLEERMGQVLVLRGSPCTGTDAGRQLCLHFEQVALLENSLRRNHPGLHDGQVTTSPTLQLAVNADSLSTWFMDAVAAPNLAEFSGTYTTPGVQILAGAYFGDITMGELVDFFDFSADCTYDGRFDYADPVYTGVYDQYSNCAGAGSVIIVLAAEPAAQNYSVIVLVQAVTEADLDALDHILNTFNVVGTLPGQ